MAPNTDTVIALKTSFLRTQTRILSQPLQPTQQWLERNEDAGELSESAVRQVMREGRLAAQEILPVVYSSCLGVLLVHGLYLDTASDLSF